MRIIGESAAANPDQDLPREIPHTLWLTSGVQIDDSGFFQNHSVPDTDRLQLILPMPHKQPNPLFLVGQGISSTS